VLVEAIGEDETGSLITDELADRIEWDAQSLGEVPAPVRDGSVYAPRRAPADRVVRTGSRVVANRVPRAIGRPRRTRTR
jgi:hypothetical protein